MSGGFGLVIGLHAGYRVLWGRFWAGREHARPWISPPGFEVMRGSINDNYFLIATSTYPLTLRTYIYC